MAAQNLCQMAQQESNGAAPLAKILEFLCPRSKEVNWIPIVAVNAATGRDSNSWVGITVNRSPKIFATLNRKLALQEKKESNHAKESLGMKPLQGI